MVLTTLLNDIHTAHVFKPNFAARAVEPFKSHEFGRKSRSSSKGKCRAGSSDDDSPPEVQGDWRAFRAGLISQAEQSKENTSSIAQANVDLLRQQDPGLASEPLWAHPIERPEVGSVLLASLKAPDVLNDPRMWQLVVLIVGDGEATSGVILNRPSIARVGDLFDRIQEKQDQDMTGVAKAFQDNVVYLGGMFAPNKLQTQSFFALHQHKGVKDSAEVVPGVYMGGYVEGAEAVMAGKIPPNTFRFFCGMIHWAPGQLRLEVDSGIWHPVACSRNLVTKQCLKLPVPLWQEIMRLLGGKFAAMADKAQSQQ